MSSPALHHVAVAVADLDASAAFYVEVLGAEVVLRDDDLGTMIADAVGQPGLTAALVHLRLPGSPGLLELMAFPDAPVPAGADWGDRTVAAGLAHVSFRVADLAATTAHAERAGARPIGAVSAFPLADAVLLREPGGSTIELTQLR